MHHIHVEAGVILFQKNDLAKNSFQYLTNVMDSLYFYRFGTVK